MRYKIVLPTICLLIIASSMLPVMSATRLRLMTYNVQHLMGSDDVVSVERVARVINDVRPDVVALQELDSMNEWRQSETLSKPVHH